MESNNKIIGQFLSIEDRLKVIEFANTLKDIKDTSISNNHISYVASGLNGRSHMFDITNTDISSYLSKFQSDNNICVGLPELLYDIMLRISNRLGISREHVFVQLLDMDKGGKINPHYDTSINEFINFKCNISVLSDDYKIYIGDNELDIKVGDLYTFESSLYKHHTDEFNNRRILLSYGFALKYKDLGRSENDPRVRLSRRIERYFQ